MLQRTQDKGALVMQALSYYKIFGYPTGLGALLVRKDALKRLRKRYFGGGAVSVSVADHNVFRCNAASQIRCTYPVECMECTTISTVSFLHPSRIADFCALLHSGAQKHLAVPMPYVFVMLFTLRMHPTIL